MFDQLNNVRESWENNSLVLVEENKDSYYFVLPAQIANSELLNTIRKKSYGNFSVILPHEVIRDLEIPSISTISKTLASRFHIMTQLFRNNHKILKVPHTITFGPKFDTTQSMEILGDYLQKIGDIIENRIRNEITKDEFQKEFYSISQSPGPLSLIKAEFQTLMQSNSISELAIALGDIARFPGAMIITSLYNGDGRKVSEQYFQDREDNYVVIDSSTIINLWRSVKKIDKEDIVYLK